MRRQEEAEHVQQTQEAAGDQEVHYIETGLTFNGKLWRKHIELHCFSRNLFKIEMIGKKTKKKQ